MQGINPQEFIYLIPEIFLGVCGMILLLAGVLGRGLGNREATVGAMFSLVVTLGLVVWIQQDLSETRVILSGLFVMDAYAYFWKLVMLIATGLTVCLSTRFIEQGGYRPAEYYSLLLLAPAPANRRAPRCWGTSAMARSRLRSRRPTPCPRPIARA